MSEKETIVVIGAGVLGLTTALTIQQSLPTQNILLIARDFPSTTSINYTSPWAGAHYRPVPGHTLQAIREESQAQYSYTQFRTEAANPASGVSLTDAVEHLENPPAEYLDESVFDIYADLDGFRKLAPGELPPSVKWGVQYRTFCINSPVYCAYLLRKFILRGGETREYTLANPKEAFYLAGTGTGTGTRNVKTVVNCSGMGFGDEKSFIIRGQTCLVRNPCTVTLTRQNSDGTWSFCIPRPLEGGTIIGGTKQPHNWDPNPSPETRERLLRNAAKWFPFTAESGGQFDVIRDIVGRRPAREEGVRIEVEDVDVDGLQGRIVHGYGAGGRGYELSWGVARDVAALVGVQKARL